MESIPSFNLTMKFDLFFRAKERLESAISKGVLVQHIFQGLILGSGINWAQDEEMTDLVLSLGQSIETKLKPRDTPLSPAGS